MFNNVVLDVVIGLIFVFLLYSLLMTIIQEIISRWFNLRANTLFRAMERMLKDDPGYQGNKIGAFFHERVEELARLFKGKKPTGLLKQFYGHPSVKYLAENDVASKPSYLNPQTFSQTMLQLLRGHMYDGSTMNESSLVKNALQNNLLNLQPETLLQFQNLFADARQDVYVFRAKLENWFNETMQRANGWYKKQIQTLLVILGFIMAVAFNIDAIAISRILMNDKDAREQMVQMAIASADAYGNMIKEQQQAKEKVDSLNVNVTVHVQKDSATQCDTVVINNLQLQVNASYDSLLLAQYKTLLADAERVQNIMGLGWGCSNTDSVDAVCKTIQTKLEAQINAATDSTEKARWQKLKNDCLESCYVCEKNPYQGPWYEMIFGWLITALAISLGAPFWFDLLNKFIKLRETGTKPPTAGSGNAAVTNPPSVPGTTADGQIIRG